MYPPRFEYTRPDSLEEALELLAEKGDEAKVLAGGQSLIPLLKLRFASPGFLVDVNRIPDLSDIRASADGVMIGALARHNEIASSEVIERAVPAMASAAPQISDPLVRNLGTIGGSLGHADPAGDWGAVMLALGASVVVESSTGSRTIRASQLFVDTFTTLLEPNEMITEIRVPRPAGRAHGTYLKLERKVGDFATVGVAVQLELSNGHIGRAGIGLTAVGPTNIRAGAAEQALAGAEPTREAFEEAGRLAAEAADPVSDVRGSADYKRAIVRTFVVRGLSRCLEAARGA